MTTSLITIWHCDARGCQASAPEKTPGWVNAVWTHGCPDHADLIAAHKASLTDVTRGRGRAEKTTWYLTCACGWQPTPNWRTYTFQPLRDQHIAHVAAAPSLPTENARALRHAGHGCGAPGVLADDFVALLAALAEARQDSDIAAAGWNQALRERDEARAAQIVVQCDDPGHAERELMRPVVEAAQVWRHAGWNTMAGDDAKALSAAVDTYETRKSANG